MDWDGFPRPGLNCFTSYSSLCFAPGRVKNQPLPLYLLNFQRNSPSPIQSPFSSFKVWWYSFDKFCLQSMTLNVAIYEWSSLTACYVRQSLNSNVHLFPVKHCRVGCSQNMTAVHCSVIVVRMFRVRYWHPGPNGCCCLLLLLWRDWSSCQDNELFTTSPTATAAQQQQRDWP